MVQVCFCVLFTFPYFLLLSILSFARETQFFWDSFVQYNLWWREPRYVAETATFPRVDEFVGTQ
jgi:hypothetical protein